LIGTFLQAHLVAHLAVLKGIATHVVERIAIHQLRRPQGAELLWRGVQFDLGRHDLLHTTSIIYLHQKRRYVVLMKMLR
jgi:hypothetical protein